MCALTAEKAGGAKVKFMNILSSRDQAGNVSKSYVAKKYTDYYNYCSFRRLIFFVWTWGRTRDAILARSQFDAQVFFVADNNF